MPEIPEHLRKRAQQRRQELSGEDGAPAEAPAPEPPAAEAPAEEAPAAAGDAPATPAAAPAGGSSSRIPAHLLARSSSRKGGKDAGDAAPAAAGVATTGGRAATATATAPVVTATGPGGNTHRLLTVVKAGSIQQVRAEAQDKVHVWPHLLVSEFASLLILMALTTIFSALVRAPLLETANFNQTPNPSKAPWYFLGLQELLTIWHPMVAGVTIPGMGLILLIMAPYMDKNPSNKPADRKFAICLMTIHLMFWCILVIFGSFFRGPGFNFVFPWEVGVFFDL